MADPVSRFGYVALLGRPNVGKSTLLNGLLGQKLSIISPKPQTTRHRILGVKTEEHYQVAYLDTPGLHRSRGRAINRHMNRAAESAIPEADVVLFLVEALRWTGEDALVLERLSEFQGPVLLVVNKVDRVPDKTRLLPFLAESGARRRFAEVVPICARTGRDVARLEAVLVPYLPEGTPGFPEEVWTDRSARFLAAEAIREKLFIRLGQEVPYRMAVEIERFDEGGKVVEIAAVIWVESAGQKAIVVGDGGRVLKQAGTEARSDIEAMLERRVDLRLWVKVRKGWSDDDRALRGMGYAEEG